MKIAVISTNDCRGGAAMVTTRLTAELRRQGHDAQMLVAERQSSEPWIHKVNTLRFMTSKVAERGQIFINNGFTRRDLWRVSTARFGAGVARHSLVRQADAIIISWSFQGLLSLADIQEIAVMGKPMVVLMHDLWWATGICHIPAVGCTKYTSGCGSCPFLHGCASATDLSDCVFADKLSLMQRIENVRFVAVSSWQKTRCLESPLFKGSEINLIPNAFPIEDYQLSVGTEHHDVPTIIMGAARLDDPVKDLPTAIAAINLLHDRGVEAHVIFFGSIADDAALRTLRMPYEYVGSIADPRQLYRCADIVLSSSLFEMLPGTIIEGMALGCIPVATNVGGQADIITDGLGFLVPPSSPQALADALSHAIASIGSITPADLHASIAERYAASKIARQLFSLINSSPQDFEL